MNIITLDFETEFDDDYTLKKMTTEAYVRDPRFRAHGCGIKGSGKHTWWLNEPEFRDWTTKQDWSQIAALCHHAHFDGLILSHHYGVRPALWLDTLSMARALIGNHLSVSLESLAAHFGLAVRAVPGMQ